MFREAFDRVLLFKDGMFLESLYFLTTSVFQSSNIKPMYLTEMRICLTRRQLSLKVSIFFWGPKKGC
jgi:hypothetical protein